VSARSTIITFFALGLMLGAGSTCAADSKSIQGTLIGSDGKPLMAGEIRAQRLDAKAKPAITTTDARGHYVFTGLPAGTYSVTAYVDGAPTSRANVRTSSKGWAKVDFDLRVNDSGDEGVDRMQRDLRTNTGR
jgi:hypothetical protein